VNNKLPDQYTSIHYHGLFQTGTTSMDGPAGVTQCPIAPGQSFTYDFVVRTSTFSSKASILSGFQVNQPGTYWYHSHMKGQYIDGLRGAFIVHDPSAPFEYDEEVYLTMSDWYHAEAPGLINYFESQENEDDGGSEPIPDTALLGDGQNTKIDVLPNKTYFFRLINIGSFVGMYLSMPGHTMTIVEVDGVYTKPYDVNQLYLTVAQRYSVLVKTKSDTSANFPILAALDEAMFDHIPPDAQPNVYGYLIYDSSKPLPPVTPLTNLTEFNDMVLQPQDGMGALRNTDHQILITMDFSDGLGINR
jgi:iron transport multicopper oxidase